MENVEHGDLAALIEDLRQGRSNGELIGLGPLFIAEHGLGPDSGWLVRDVDAEVGVLLHVYRAGVLVLDRHAPGSIRYRSSTLVLTAEPEAERQGVVVDVVFPTAVYQRLDLRLPNRLDVYYGMADSRIGVARLDLPEQLPREHALTPIKVRSEAHLRTGRVSVGSVDRSPNRGK